MTGYLLDTNVLSEVVKKRPSETVLSRLRAVSAATLFTSSVCVMELRFGAARVPDGAALWSRIVTDVLALVTVLPFGGDDAVRAGDLLADLAARGTPIGLEDVIIAATAQTRRLVVVTRNDRHLARVQGLAVENWWR